MFSYALETEAYSWKNALLWGNFSLHSQKVVEGSLKSRVVHLIIAIAEFLPIIGQIASIAEKFIITSNTPLLHEVSIKLIENVKLDKNIAATKIQSVFRAHLARKEKRALGRTRNIQNNFIGRLKQKLIVKTDAAIKIQSTLRTHLNAKEESTFANGKPFIDEPKNLIGLSSTSGGNAKVYFLNDLPIVLKHSETAVDRFNKMEIARDLIERNNYSCLIVPDARLHGNFIIEKRLPFLPDQDTKIHIGFYIDHLKEFDAAVQQFTGFLCQIALYDISGNTTNAYSTLSTVPIGRYDNVALYIENSVGNIGLIDLERLYVCSPTYFFQCREAIRLFPYHFDLIIQTVKKFDPKIEENLEKLENERNEVLKYFDKAYLNHLKFVQANNIGLSNPKQFFAISNDRIVEIKNSMEVMLRNENGEYWYKNLLGTAPDESLKLFNDAFPEILESVLKFTKEMLEKHVDRSGKTFASYGELLAARTLKFGGYGHKKYDQLKKFIIEKTPMLQAGKHKQDGIAEEIINKIYKELEGKEIAYFNPSFGVGSYASPCLFC